MVKALEKMVAALQKRSEEITRLTEDPALVPFLRAARANQLNGMLEAVDLLIQHGVEVPAMAVGFIHSEIERVSK